MASRTAATLHGDGKLEAPAQTPNVGTASATTTRAETYNPALAPLGAHLQAKLTPSGESTIAEFTVEGLLPNRGYAVQANVNSCGGDPDAEGPHYQNRIDPAVTPAATGMAPSTDPEYANPNNEIWLDVRTDASGSGTSRTTVPFVFTDRGPGSIVVGDAQQTGTGPGQAGKGGARIACLTLSAVQPQGVNPRGSQYRNGLASRPVEAPACAPEVGRFHPPRPLVDQSQRFTVSPTGFDAGKVPLSITAAASGARLRREIGDVVDGLVQLPHPPSSPVVHRILPDLRSQANMTDIIVHTDVWIAAAPGSSSFLPRAYRLECRSVFDVRVDRLAADVVVIAAVGEIDSVTAPTLSASLHRELEHAPTVLVLDLTGVSFLGVAGLHVLDCALARAETLSVTVKLVHDEHSAVQSALRAAAMTGLFPTFRTVDLACAPSS